MAVSIELDLDTSTEAGPSTYLTGATAAPCGSFDVTFSSAQLVDAGADARYLVRVVPLGGQPQPGVVRRLGALVAPAA
jgi:hypothetical protein